MGGARTEPCGTPESRVTSLLSDCPTLTLRVLLSNHVLRNLMNTPGSPSFMHLWSSPVCHTLSKAFFASKNVSIVVVGKELLIAYVYEWVNVLLR